MTESFLAAASARAADGIGGALSTRISTWRERVPKLAAYLTDTDATSDSRRAIMEELCDATPPTLIHPHLADILPCLCDEDIDVCFAATTLLLACCNSDCLAPHASQLLGHFERAPDSARWRVAEVLALIDESVLAARTSDVLALCSSASDDVRRRAVELMAKLPVATIQEHVGALLPRLEDEDEDCRLSALELFQRQLPPETVEAHLAAILQRLEDDEEGMIRMTAVGTIARLPVATLVTLTPRLIARLEDGFWRVRRHAMEVLATLPPSARRRGWDRRAAPRAHRRSRSRGCRGVGRALGRAGCRWRALDGRGVGAADEARRLGRGPPWWSAPRSVHADMW